MRRVNGVGMSYCVKCHAYSTTNSLEPTKALGSMWVRCSLPFRNLKKNKKRRRETAENERNETRGELKSTVCNCISACDSQFVHLCAVEGVTCHLLDAISGEPSVIGKRSQITVMWQQHRVFPTVKLSQLILVWADLLFSVTKAAWIHRILVKTNLIYSLSSFSAFSQSWPWKLWTTSVCFLERFGSSMSLKILHYNPIHF